MSSELLEEEAFFACGGVRYAFRRWARGDGACASPVVPAASSLADCASSASSSSSATAAVPVILLHGFAQSAALWGEVAALLLESGAFASVYALDFAGHGKSLRAGCDENPDTNCSEDPAARCGENPDERWAEDARSGDACSGGAYLDDVRSDLTVEAARMRQRRVERVDAVGGRSAYEMDAACEAVRSFVEFVACREGAVPVLVGYSMGGRIALECLVRYGASARRFCDGVPEGCLAGRGSSSERESSGERDVSGGRSVLDAWPRSDGQDALGDRDVPDVLSVSASWGASGGQDVSGSLLVSALVLESAGLGPADEAARLSLEKRNAAWARRLREEGVASFMDYWQDLPLFESQRALSPERRAAQRAARLANSAEALACAFEGTGAHRQSAETVSLAALRDATAAGLPVLYLAGSLDVKYRAVAQRIAAGCGIAQSAAAGCDIARSAVAGCHASVEEPLTSGDSPCASAACERASAVPLRASSACRCSSAELFSQKMAIFCVCGTSEEEISPDSHQAARVGEEGFCVSAGHGRVDISHPSAAAIRALDDAEKVRQIAKNGQKTGNKFRGRFSELSDEGVSGTSSELSAERASDIASECPAESATGAVSDYPAESAIGVFSERAFGGASDAVVGVLLGLDAGRASGGALEVDAGRASRGAPEVGVGRASKGAPEVVVVEGVGHNIHFEKPEEFARILGCFAAGAGLAR